MLARKRHAMKASKEVSIVDLAPTPNIIFTKEGERGAHMPRDDALVVNLDTTNYKVKRIFIDNGSFAYIIFLVTLCN